MRLKIHSVGYAPGTFYVFQQVYDADGNPIEGEYVDRNGDGVITDNDLYRYKKPTADVLMGFNSKFTYKQWDLGFKPGQLQFQLDGRQCSIGRQRIVWEQCVEQ